MLDTVDKAPVSKRRVLLFIALAVGVLSLFVCLLFYVQRRSFLLNLTYGGIFSFEGLGYFMSILFGKGLFLCVIPVCFLFLKRFLGVFSGTSSEIEQVSDSSEKPVVKHRSFAWAGFLCFGLSSVAFSLWYRYGFLDIMMVLCGLFFVFGIAFLLTSRKRFCWLVAGVSCFLVSIIDFSLWFGVFCSIFYSIDWNSISSDFVTVRFVYFLVFMLLLFGFVGVIGLGGFLLLHSPESSTSP